MAGHLKLNRGEMTEDLLSRPNEFTLLSIIAYRARRKSSTVAGLKPNQALIGDYASYGMTRAAYRYALNNLKKYNLITTQITNRGTIATLLNTEVYDINAETTTNEVASQQPTARPPNDHPRSHPTTTNEECKKGNNGNKGKKKKGTVAQSPPSLAEWIAYGKSLDPPFPESQCQSTYDYYVARGWQLKSGPMRDWKASLRTCWHNWKKEGGPQKERPKEETFDYKFG